MSENLYLKHHKRSYPIKKGDTVKVLRGSFRGKSGKIVEVDRKKYKVAIDGITLAKTDGTQVQFWIHPSNLLITKLDLSDRLRRKKLALSEEEIEETTETEETETTESVVKEENKVVEQNKTEVEQSEQKKAVSKKPAKSKSAGKKEEEKSDTKKQTTKTKKAPTKKESTKVKPSKQTETKATEQEKLEKEDKKGDSNE